MSARVLKYDVPVDDQWHPIGRGPVVAVACQTDVAVVQVWAIESGETEADRQVRAFGTGQPLPKYTWHVGTTVTNVGLVWHLFSTAPAPSECEEGS